MLYPKLNRDFFLDKKREKAKLEAELKLQVTLKVIVPAGEAKAAPPLNVICGQYYINMPDFCNLFNDVSSKWNNIPLPVIVKKGLRAKEFDLFIKPPTTRFLLDIACGRVSNRMYYCDLWAVIKFYQKHFFVDEYSAAKSVFSCLNYNIHFEEEIAIKDQQQLEINLTQT